MFFFILDLFNREIIGFSAGKNKDANLVHKAFASIGAPLDRSLSKKGSPYDNAVAEATFKIFKTELISQRKFDTLAELKREVFDYVNWYNIKRIHGSLGYLTPVEFKKKLSVKKVS